MASDRRLSRAQLNRTLLERQLLLRRATMEPLDAVEHLVAMQCQEPPAPFYGLWSRLEGFEAQQLVHLLESRKVARGTLMRTTLHLVSARDMLGLRPVVQSRIARHWEGSPFRKQLDGVDVGAVVAAGRELLREQPRNTTELGRALQERWPDADRTALAYAVRFLLPVVQLPPRGTSLARAGGQPVAADAEDWLGAPLAEADPGALILRYLAAYGPSSVADIRMWSGLAGVAEVVQGLRERLRVFEDERGRELLDVPDAPVMSGDEPAPPRFLPWFDNILLAHDDRSRILPHEHRLGVVGASCFVLVDGFARATWRIERAKQQATLRITPLEPLGETEAVVAEGERLLAWADPEAEREVVVG